MKVIPSIEETAELIRKGVTAVAGLLAFLGVMYGGLCVIWLVMEAPESFALLASASVIAAAIYFRAPQKTYNLSLGHPDTERVIAAVHDLLAKGKQ